MDEYSFIEVITLIIGLLNLAILVLIGVDVKKIKDKL